MKLHKVTQLGWQDVLNYFHEREKKYGISELRISAVVQPQMVDDATALPPTTFGQLMVCLHIVPGISQMPQGTSQPGKSWIRLGSVKPQSNMNMPSREPAV